MDRLKYIKLENEDGSYSSSIPLAVDSDHVDVNGNTLTNKLNTLATKTEVEAVASGSPLVASSISGMTDTTRVYVNTTDGHWYYYNGSAWTDGGVYQSSVNVDSINSVFASINDIGNNGVKLYEHDMTLTQANINNWNYTVSYSASTTAYIYALSHYKNYVIKKTANSSRFRVGLIKNNVPNSSYSGRLEMAKIIIDENDADSVAFNSLDYNYVVVLLSTGSTSSTAKIYTEEFSSSANIMFLTNTKTKNENIILENNYSNINNLDLWENGNINNSTGVNEESPNHIRTKNFIDENIIKLIRESSTNEFEFGVRIYDLNENFLGSYGYLSTAPIEIPFNHKYLKYKLIIYKIDININSAYSVVNLISTNTPLLVNPIIDKYWSNWNDIRYSYGFDINKQSIYKTVKGVLESDTMMSVRGGKGRWNKTDNPSSSFVNGGHVFEGWDGNEKFRLTMLIGKFFNGFACIQTYSPAGLYEENRRFGWVKIGSDEQDYGVDFSTEWTKFYTPLTLQTRSSAPTKVPNADLCPRMNSYSNSVPIGTMYYDTTLARVRVYTSAGWKNLKFED